MSETDKIENLDQDVVNHFGKEWKSFDQSSLVKNKLIDEFNKYFSIFPWESLPIDSVGFDAGCGSGRWGQFVAPKVSKLHCIDPSEAIEVARENLDEFDNCVFHQCGVSDMPFPNESMDFGYSLGVLHHIPDTQKGLNDCVGKLKNGAPFLLYLYYAFDNQPIWYKWIWKISDLVRRIVYRLPHKLKLFVSSFIALFVYYPLARSAKILEKFNISVHSWPLSDYRNQPFYTLRTDALDRFGTKLERRFTKKEIEEMMLKAGLGKIKFSNHAPFYCAVGIKV